MTRQTHAEKEAAADATYERGWADSLDALDRISGQPIGDIYWYRVGWDACAKYRWEDPANHGSAPDRSHRIPRKDVRR